MDLGGEGVSVYAEAKSEYTTQLCQFLVPSIQQFFLDLLDEAKGKEPEAGRVLIMFQTLLEGISEWNADKVQRETTHIVTKSRCDYLDELMTAVFIAHTKVLSAIRLTTRQKKLQITIPKLDHFLHRTLTECARLLWSNTYLFSSSAPTIERQKNLRLIENMLHEGVLQGIRGMLPVKNILREYLKDDEEDEEEDKVEEAKEESKEEPKEEPKPKEESKESKEEPKPKEESKEEPKPKEESKEESKPKEKEESKPKESKPKEKQESKEPEKKEKEAKEPPPEEKDEAEVDIDDEFEIEFTGNDTLDEKEAEVETPVAENEEGSEAVKIFDDPPGAMDDFEDMDTGDAVLPMDFEELS